MGLYSSLSYSSPSTSSFFVALSNSLLNSIKDVLGILRAISYRTFTEFNWSEPHPMFNIVEVEEHEQPTFESFLSEGQQKGNENKTRFSFGPFRNTEKGTYIYVTNYGSVTYFLRTIIAMMGKVIGKRVSSTLRALWAYCKEYHISKIPHEARLAVLGIEGDFAIWLDKMKNERLTIYRIIDIRKSVRGRLVNTYVVFKLPEETHIDKLSESLSVNEFQGKLYLVDSFEV